MTEQQYRVIADRDKGDDPQWGEVESGDRVWFSGPRDDVDRIERPVSITDEPERCEQCDDFEPETHAHPSVPTREQIAEVSDAMLVDAYWDAARDDWAIPESVMIAYGRTVLALIQKEADR